MFSEKFLSSKKIYSHLFKNNFLKNVNKLDEQYSNLSNIENKKKYSKNKLHISKKRKRNKPLLNLLNNNNKDKITKKIKNKCVQKIKEEYNNESESDSVSISFNEQDEINNKIFPSNDIISNILNQSEVVIKNKNNLPEIITNINLNEKQYISYDNNNTIFCFIKIKSIYLSRDFSYAIFNFYRKLMKNKNEDYENILYKINSQNEEDFIEVLQQMKSLNSYIKCELIKKTFLSTNNKNLIMNNMEIYFLKKYYFKNLININN
jgi:hypothetical protein